MNGIRTACRQQLLHQPRPMAALAEMAVAEEVAQAADRLEAVAQAVAAQAVVVAVWFVEQTVASLAVV